MNVRLVLLLLLLTGQRSTLLAQEILGYVWWNPVTNKFPVIEGQAWPKEVKEPYSRLPVRAEKSVSKAIWNLSRQSAGLMLRFTTNASQITVRYGVSGPQALPHMPATGVSGIDLYALNADGDMLWCGGKYAFKDTVTYHFANLEPSDQYHKKGREYRLYLPLYNTLTWLEVGVPDQAAFTPLPVRIEKPIVVYGTSIAQGACASRPGMAWPSIVERKMDRTVVNLGFSGNGRLDKEVMDLVIEIDAKAYILDCLPNMVASGGMKPEEVYDRIIAAVKMIRQKRPTTPIILTEHAGYTDALTNPVRRQFYLAVNEIAQKAIAALKGEGISDIHLLTQAALNQDIDTMVDGTHPSDLGMLRYAEAYEKILRVAIHEPVDTFATTRPKRQTRDASIYDWEKRHREIVALNKTHPPRLVLIGNSITHYWGGQPQAPKSNGADSWNTVLEPLGARNFGFGWDRIENVLWRVYHEEFDDFQLKQAVVLIGTNNLQFNSDPEITAGLQQLLQAIQVRQPGAALVVMGLLPRRKQEQRIEKLNQEIKQLAARMNIIFTDASPAFLNADGSLNEALFSDGLHPNQLGYEKLAHHLKPHLLPAETKGKGKKSGKGQRLK